MVGMNGKTQRGRAYLRLLQRLGVILCLGTWLLGGRGVLAQSPEPPAMPTADRLAAPLMPAHPTQADYGAQVYYLVCMACHGDRGQGLTDEWRAAWSPDDQHCWQSKCHAANHPSDGFKLVRYVPPVIGEGVLVRSRNAAALHDYISTQMPWQKPGSLTDEEYWQLTAFLLRANGLYSSTEPLGPENAAGVALAAAGGRAMADLPGVAPPEMPPPQDSVARGWLVALVVLLMVAVLAVIWAMRRARSSPE